MTHTLAFNYPVVAIDCDNGQTHNSQHRGKTIVNSKHHRMPRVSASFNSDNDLQRQPITHVTSWLDPSTLSTTLASQPSTNDAASQARERYALVGLHACGDLGGSTMLRSFLQCEDVQTLGVVGCCYQLMDLKGMIQLWDFFHLAVTHGTGNTILISKNFLSVHI